MTAPEAQLPLHPTCPRCGWALLPVEDLAAVAGRLAERATAAGAALDGMRLALPTTLTAAIRDLAADAPLLARALACHGGVCIGGGRAAP